MNILNRFVTDSIFYGIPSIVSKGIAVFLLPLYTSVLKPEDYGRFDLVVLCITALQMVALLEISQGVARYFSTTELKLKKQIYASIGLLFSFLITFLICVLGWFGSEFFSVALFDTDRFSTLVAVGFLFLVSNTVYAYSQGLLRWIEKPLAFCGASLAQVFGSAFFSVFFCYFLDFGATGLLGGMALGALIGGLLATWHLRSYFIPVFSYLALRRTLRFSKPLVLAAASVWLSSYSDRIIISMMLDEYSLGVYGVAFRLASVVLLVLAGLKMTVTPFVYKNRNSAALAIALKYLFELSVMFSVALSLLLGVFVHYNFEYILSPEYADSVYLIGALSISLAIGSLYVFFPGIYLSGKTRLISLISVFFLVVRFPILYGAVYYFGLKGLVFAGLILSAFNLYAFYRISNRFFEVKYKSVPLMLVVAVGSVFTIFLEVLYELFDDEEAFMLLGILFYFVVVLLMIYFSAKRLYYLRAF